MGYKAWAAMVEEVMATAAEALEEASMASVGMMVVCLTASNLEFAVSGLVQNGKGRQSVLVGRTASYLECPAPNLLQNEMGRQSVVVGGVGMAAAMAETRW